MYGYIYKTTNLINGKQYIGRRKADHFLGNEYLGSGRHLKNAINKYGAENFTVEYIDCANTLDDLVELERYYIKLSNAVVDDNFYNSSPGGPNEGWVKGNGNIALRPDILEINRTKHLGKKMSDEFREHQRQIHLGKPSGMLGHHHSDEAKVKIGIQSSIHNTNRDRSIYDKLSQTKMGNKMMNKDGICHRVYPDMFEEYLLNGWKFGGLSRKQYTHYKHKHKRLTSSTKGKICINNGVQNKFIAPNDLEHWLCNGWSRGMIKKDNS